MRKLVIASLLLASSHLALAQGTGDGAPPPDDTANKQAPGDAEAKKAPPPPEGEDKGNTDGTPDGSEPAPPPEPPKDEKPSVTATYDKGVKFESSDKKYELKLLFRNQMRFESARLLDGDPLAQVVASSAPRGQFLSKFYIPRSRLQAEGHVFGDDDRYKLEFSFSDGGSFGFTKDMYIEHKISPAPVWLRFGQWKRPFFRQEMVSDFGSEFNERSIVSDFAGGGRDLGIALHNDYEKSAEGIEWAVGMFNTFSGAADRPTFTNAIPPNCSSDPATGKLTCIKVNPTNFPVDFGPTIVARAGWNSARSKGYSEADLEGGPLRYSVAAAYKIDLANFAKHDEPSLADNLSHGLELDWNVKVNGISFSGGAVMMKLKSDDAQFGFVLQPGLMVVPKHIEVAARFALVTEAGDRTNIEALGAFNYFVHGHQLKIATDFGILKKTGEDSTMMTDKPDMRLRVMGQMEI